MGKFKLFNNRTETKKVKFVPHYDDFDQDEINAVKEDILERFFKFRSLLLNNQVDFTRLQEYDLAFLRACNINLGLQLASGYTCSIERLSSTLVSYRIDKIELNDKKISYNLGKLESCSWDSFDRISVEEKDIKISKAILNMAKESSLPLICSEYKFLDEVQILTDTILSSLQETTSSNSDEVEDYSTQPDLI